MLGSTQTYSGSPQGDYYVNTNTVQNYYGPP